jgi:hypothetical protein
MLTMYRITIDHFVEELQKAYRRTYSDLDPHLGNLIGWTGRLVLENISNSDALYHNLEHTVMVTMAGQSIIEGKHLVEGGVTPEDWMHYTLALLCHDIGYVRGVLKMDNANTCATGIGDEIVKLPDGGTDIALTPYHVDRSKQFVRERFGKKLLQDLDSIIDVERIASYIEMTRFPPPKDEAYADTRHYGGLTRAADFIGQLGDPNYLRKTPALFYEFEETNSNEKLGYTVPADLRRSYAGFFWNVVNPYIEDALKYLQRTQEGKQWIANLYAHVFTAEHANEAPVQW